MAYLTRFDASQNLNRFYIVDVTPTLFGEWAFAPRMGPAGAAHLAQCGCTAMSDWVKRSGRSTARSSAGCSTAILSERDRHEPPEIGR
jgi:hypothetical protein